jgi:serine/threonine protein kinase
MNPWQPGMQVGPYELLAGLGGAERRSLESARLEAHARGCDQEIQGSDEGRFNREAQSIAALNHPRICQDYDVGPDYLVLEYIEGRPLQCPMTPDEAVSVALEIARAVQTAHARGSSIGTSSPRTS